MSLYHTKHSPEFPKMKYAPAGGAVMVHTKTEELALGPGWTDTDPESADVDGIEVDDGAAAPAPAKKKRGKK